MCSLPSLLVSVSVEHSNDGLAWSPLIPFVPHVGIADGLTLSPYVVLPDHCLHGDHLIRATAKGNGALDPVLRKLYLELV